MNTILGELGKNPKFCEYIKTIESKKKPDSHIGLNRRWNDTNDICNKRICKKTNLSNNI